MPEGSKPEEIKQGHVSGQRGVLGLSWFRGLPAPQQVAVVVAAIGLAGTLAKVVIPKLPDWVNPPRPTLSPTLAATSSAAIRPTPDPIVYQVLVKDRVSGESVTGAEVAIGTSHGPPYREVTDATGYATLYLPASYAGEPAYLIVEAAGYHGHDRHIELPSSTLPVIVQLRPKRDQ